MSKLTVKELITKSLEGFNPERPIITRNERLQTDMLTAVMTDDTHVTKYLDGVVDGENQVVEVNLAKEFKDDCLVPILRKGGMSEAEAQGAAENFKVPRSMAKVINKVVKEADQLMISKCHKKIRVVNNPDHTVDIFPGTANATQTRIPNDPTRIVKIAERKVFRVKNYIREEMKEIVNI